jgi:branched-chain amino acid transport system substrate-binding protein
MQYIFLFILCFSLSQSLHAEIGVTDSEIKIETINAQSGPAASLGLELNAGAKALISRINASGGIHGRKIKWILKDDTYEPEKTLNLLHEAISADSVFCLFNFVGTPTINAVIPLISRTQIPLVGAFTGAEILRNPINKQIFNIRASYWDETHLMVEALIRHGINDIGVFYQDDSFGDAVRSGVYKALKQNELKIATEGRFKRNTEDITDGFNTILKIKPRAIILAGTSKVLALFVKKAKAENYNPIFLNVSFVGTAGFIKAVGNEGENSYITQVVPHPELSQVNIVKKFRADMKASGKSEITFGALEGYLNALVLTEGLKIAGKNLDRESFRKALESIDTDFGGFKISFSENNHQGSKKVYLTKVHSNKAVEVSEID